MITLREKGVYIYKYNKSERSTHEQVPGLADHQHRRQLNIPESGGTESSSSFIDFFVRSSPSGCACLDVFCVCLGLGGRLSLSSSSSSSSSSFSSLLLRFSFSSACEASFARLKLLARFNRLFPSPRNPLLCRCVVVVGFADGVFVAFFFVSVVVGPPPDPVAAA